MKITTFQKQDVLYSLFTIKLDVSTTVNIVTLFHSAYIMIQRMNVSREKIFLLKKAIILKFKYFFFFFYGSSINFLLFV